MDLNLIKKELCEQLGASFSPIEPFAMEVPDYKPQELASFIDHTILKPEASLEDVRKICNEAKEFGFASVCVNPSYIGFVAKELEGTAVKPCCVVGFPFGTHTPVAIGAETADAVANGAKEVDMVINVGAVKNKDWALLKEQIEAVVSAASGKAAVKVIIETCLLTDEEKVCACVIAQLAGADFVKTSTGYSKGGATAEDVALMRTTVGPNMGVKASGGIRTYEDALKMMKAGASRLGCSAGVAIVSAGE